MSWQRDALGVGVRGSGRRSGGDCVGHVVCSRWGATTGPHHVHVRRVRRDRPADADSQRFNGGARARLSNRRLLSANWCAGQYIDRSGAAGRVFLRDKGRERSVGRLRGAGHRGLPGEQRAWRASVR